MTSKLSKFIQSQMFSSNLFSMDMLFLPRIVFMLTSKQGRFCLYLFVAIVYFILFLYDSSVIVVAICFSIQRQYFLVFKGSELQT